MSLHPGADDKAGMAVSRLAVLSGGQEQVLWSQGTT